MSYIDQITVGSTTYDIQDSNAQRKAITGSGAPTTSTTGAVGDYYIDTSATAAPYLYMCVDATGGTYTWERIDGKVNKSGDTMTGNLIIEGNDDPGLAVVNTEMDTSASSLDIQTDTVGSTWAFKDKNNRISGYLKSQQYAFDGLLKFFFKARRFVNNENVNNGLELNIDKDGNKYVYVDDPQAWRDGLSAVNKTGDTMTGDLTISKSDDTPRFISKNSNIDITGTNLPSSTQYDGIYFRDANDNNIGYCESAQTSAGEIHTDLVARRNASVINRLRLGFDANGTRIVEVGNSASAWRAALGLTYAVNDTQELDPCILNGYIGNSSKSFYFVCYTPKSLENISTITVTAMTGALRSTNGNIGGTSSSTDIKSGYTIATRRMTNNSIRIQVTASSAFSSVTNFAPAVFGGTMTLKFT